MYNQQTQQQNSIFSNAELEKIKAEEMLRKQIRDELSEKPKEKAFMKFLNSPFMLLILSSVLITGAGNIISRKIAKQNVEKNLRIENNKYQLELNNRIFRMKQLL